MAERWDRDPGISGAFEGDLTAIDRIRDHLRLDRRRRLTELEDQPANRGDLSFHLVDTGRVATHRSPHVETPLGHMTEGRQQEETGLLRTKKKTHLR